jgi:NTP pyrophosphatase (non-canonical NTP hydrolase)
MITRGEKKMKMIYDNEMTFDDFQQRNEDRCKTAFLSCADWSLNDWLTALGGEVGEAMNIAKKIRRGDYVGDHAAASCALSELAKEIADVIIYADLIMTELGRNTGQEVQRKFDEVSKRVSYKR